MAHCALAGLPSRWKIARASFSDKCDGCSVPRISALLCNVHQSIWSICRSCVLDCDPHVLNAVPPLCCAALLHFGHAPQLSCCQMSMSMLEPTGLVSFRL